MLDFAPPPAPWRTCFSLLPKVSRTFALSITLLKPPMRHSVCLGYLLCRLIDTFEDAETLDTPRKAHYIQALQAFVAGEAIPEPDWARRAAHALGDGASPADRELLESLEAVLAALSSLPLHDRQALVRCFQEMATGMIEMQTLLDQPPIQPDPPQALLDPSPTPQPPPARALRILPTMPSLGRYCHYVAGVVGQLLTELLFLNSEALSKERYFDLLERSEAFGQFLQKINILKDLPVDHAKGWCFIPRDAILDAGVQPERLLMADPARRVGAIAPIMRDVLDHLAHAWQYLQRVPVAEREYRLFLGYSLFFGVKTLELGLKEPDRSFEGDRPLKIGRLDVAALIEKVNRLIDDPGRLDAALAALLAAARQGLDSRWPAAIDSALASLLGTLERPAPAAR